MIDRRTFDWLIKVYPSIPLSCHAMLVRQNPYQSKSYLVFSDRQINNYIFCLNDWLLIRLPILRKTYVYV